MNVFWSIFQLLFDVAVNDNSINIFICILNFSLFNITMWLRSHKIFFNRYWSRTPSKDIRFKRVSMKPKKRENTFTYKNSIVLFLWQLISIDYVKVKLKLLLLSRKFIIVANFQEIDQENKRNWGRITRLLQILILRSYNTLSIKSSHNEMINQFSTPLNV